MKTKRFLTILATMIITFLSLEMKTFSSNAIPRDPNGDGVISLGDYIRVVQYLNGTIYPSSDKTQLDFDQNGIISQIDAEKIIEYYTGNVNIVPPANSNDPVIHPTMEILNYRRHDCTNLDTTSYTSYSICPSLPINSLNNNTDSIIGQNDMQPDYDTSIVKIVSGSGWGSGFILGEHIIATAAHCVYDRTTNTFKNCTIQIFDSNENLLASYTPKYIHIPTIFATDSTGDLYQDLDYALIYVNDTIDTATYGMKKLGVALNAYVNNTGYNIVTVSGFPGQIPPNYNGNAGYKRFYANGYLFPTTHSTNPSTDYRLCYNTDTIPGDSGGPIYVKETMITYNSTLSLDTVIGIHAYGPGTYNHGVRVDEDILRFYYANEYIS